MFVLRLNKLALFLVAVLLGTTPVWAEWVPYPPMFDGRDGLGLPLQLYGSKGETWDAETIQDIAAEGLQSKRVVERREHWIPAKHDPMPRTLTVRILQFESNRDVQLYVKKAHRLFSFMSGTVRTWDVPAEVGDASGWAGHSFVFIKGATIVAVEQNPAPNGPTIDPRIYLPDVARRLSRLIP